MTLTRDPEKARAWRKRSKRIKRMSAKRASNASERLHVRGVVFARDGWRCRMAHIGGCSGFLTPHHVLKASQGGAYTEDNLVTLCAHHNCLIESDADFAALAREMGFVRYWWEGVR